MSGPTAVIDTSVFAGAKNPEEPRHQECQQLLELAHQHRFRAVVSAITVAEVCTGYHVEKDDLGRGIFLDYLRSADVFDIVPIDLALADSAARVRARTSLKLPDALILAAGLARSAKFVITHDDDLSKAGALLPSLSAGEFLRRLGSGSR